jgi:hypothetical protein
VVKSLASFLSRQHGGQEGRDRQGVSIYPRNISNGLYIPGRLLIHQLNMRQMFVFGEVQDPNLETVNLVEDIVRSQLTELVSPCFVTIP